VKIRSIGNRQEQLIKEWGGEVKGQMAMQPGDGSRKEHGGDALDEGIQEDAALDEEAENG